MFRHLRNQFTFADIASSLFIHIMPCVALHCIVHLLPKEVQRERFPAVYNIAYSSKGSPEHYSLSQMMLWATIPYATWQLSYHFLITVRRREKIAAGRPTSFTWLRRSFGKTAIGKIVLSLPESLQEPAYMGIQYGYALLTMTPCPLWFWSRWASGIFLSVVFAYSVYNGAKFYIDIFGMRFQKELEQLRRDVAKWQSTPELAAKNGLASPVFTPMEVDPNGKQLGASIGNLDGSLQERAASESDEAKTEVPTLVGSIGSNGKAVAGGLANGTEKLQPFVANGDKSASSIWTLEPKDSTNLRERRKV